MQTTRALTIPGLIAAICVGFGCSSGAANGDLIIPGGSNGTTGGTTGSGSSPGTGNGPSTGGSGPILNVGGNVNAGGMTAGGIDQCVGTSQGTTKLPPVLEFLIDYSTSMDEIPAGQTLKKYEATRNALIQSFTDMQDGTGTGLIFYPNRDVRAGNNNGTGTCITRQQAVPIATLNATVRQSLITALQNKGLSNGTPTHDAFVYATETLAASTVMGNKFVVLVTDGAPTYSLGCVGNGQADVDNTALVQGVANAAAMGIRTFVIGSPGSENARGSLSAMATQGGTAPPGCSDAGPMYCHFDMTTAPDLSAALNAAFKAITGSVITCNYTIPKPMDGKVLDLNKVNVNYTTSAGVKTDIKKDPSTTGACDHGWQYTANNTQIQLCDDICGMIKNDPMAQVNVVLGCTTIPY